jgi:hypothetical protein
MLTSAEKKLVADRSEAWRGPVCWGYAHGYRLNLKDAMTHSGFS